MSSNHYTDQVFVEKRKIKNPIKFHVPLNEEQKVAKELILSNPITVLKGKAGSGKTLAACTVGLDLLFRKEISKIVISRPTVSKEDIGFLPGDIREKMDPWLAPIYQNLYKVYDREKIQAYIQAGDIEILPFAFMRGTTFTEAFIIVDEAQNVTSTQMEMVISRLGKNSKMVICGDTSQIDLRNRKESGFRFLNIIEKQVKGFKVFELQQNHRHPIVEDILKVYEDNRE
jgi:phosphate starvation-inducible PhoH-like protein